MGLVVSDAGAVSATGECTRNGGWNVSGGVRGVYVRKDPLFGLTGELTKFFWSQAAGKQQTSQEEERAPPSSCLPFFVVIGQCSL